MKNCKNARTGAWLSSLILPMLVLVMALVDSHSAAAAQKELKGAAACLDCHEGSFDKLIAKGTRHTTATGLKVNPHQWLPHNEHAEANIPDCLECHETHPKKVKDKIDLSKVTVESCFLSCHHTENFDKCSNCHKTDGH